MKQLKSWLAEHSKVLIFKWKVQEKDDENAYRLRFARWKIRDICKSLEINVSQFGKLSQNFWKTRTLIEQGILNQVRSKTKVELIEEEYDNMTIQIETMKAKHAEELEESKSKYATEIKKISLNYK